MGFAPLGSRQDSLTRPDNPCEADASSRSTRAGARQRTKTRGSAAERKVDARIQHRSRDEARWGREPTSRREGMDRRPSSGVRWGSRYINKAMPPTLASGESSSSSSDLSGSRRSSRVERRGKAGQVRYWQYGLAESSPDLAISDLSRFPLPVPLSAPEERNGRSEERNGRQGGSGCRWPQVFHTQGIRLRPMTLFNPVSNRQTPISRHKTIKNPG